MTLGFPQQGGRYPVLPLPGQVPLRDPVDFGGTVRWTDWSGGYDLPNLQLAFGYLYISPRYWDGQNIDAWSLPGKFRLCSRWKQIGSTSDLDYEYLFYPFSVAIYKFPTANFDATKVEATNAATGTPSWTALAHAYPGATAVRNAVVWRDKLYIASGENLVRIMDSTETFTTLAAPGAVGGALAGQIGVAQDDRLLVWWESNGLYAYDGTGWVKIFPTNATAPAQPYCDAICRATGSVLFVTRDSSGISTVYEYAVEPTGTYLSAWLQDAGLRFWPQSFETFQDTTYFVCRMGADQNVGVLFEKAYRQAPNDVAYLDTNYSTPDQKGLDWAWRSLLSVGSALLAGGSSRYDHNATMYHIETDTDGTLIHPSAVMAGLAGPIYSMAVLPYGTTGASTTGRVFASAGKSTWYKDADGMGDPTADDNTTGFIENSAADLGMPDHFKIAALGSLDVLDKSDDGGISFQYRVDPPTPADSWTVLLP